MYPRGGVRMGEMSDTEARVDDELRTNEDEEEENLDDLEPSEADIESANDLPPDPVAGDAESIQEMLTKQEAREEEEHEDEDEPVVTRVKDEHPESTLDSTRVVPMQDSEFQCRKCFLVKNRSQLADKKKILCRDCA
jgi:hypothetical protein